MTAQEGKDMRPRGMRWTPGDDQTNTATQWLGNDGLHRARLRSGMRFLDVAAGSAAGTSTTSWRVLRWRIFQTGR